MRPSRTCRQPHAGDENRLQARRDKAIDAGQVTSGVTLRTHASGSATTTWRGRFRLTGALVIAKGSNVGAHRSRVGYADVSGDREA